MELYTRKPILDSVPIVPMLDILTILLIFFTVQTEFKRQVQVLDLTLPQTENISGKTGNSQDILLELGEDGSLALAGQKVAADKLVTAVQELLQKQKDATLQFSASEGASMGTFIHVLDTLTEAGLSVEQVPVRIQYTPQ